MKVSVIVPVYNMEKCLENCIDSIVGQDERDIEIILVDDGSTDGSLQICRKWEKRDSRIRVLSQKNSGVSTARNMGLKTAIGEWIMFVDPDDNLLPNAIAELMRWTVPGVDIVTACCKVCDGQKQETNFFFPDHLKMATMSEKMPLFMQLFDVTYGQPKRVFYTGIGVPWAKLYRRAFLEEKHLQFDVELRRMQDNLFNMYAFFYAEGIIYRNVPVYVYDCSHINIYANSYNPNYINIFSKVSKARMTVMEELGLYEQEALRLSFMNEQLQILRDCLKRSVLNKENQEPWAEKRNKFRQLCDYYDEEYLKGLALNMITSRRYRIFCCMERHRNAFLLYIVWNKIYPLVKKMAAGRKK